MKDRGPPSRPPEVEQPPQINTCSKRCKERSNICCRALRRLWSFQMLITVLILLVVVMTAASVWPSNYAFSSRGVRRVAILARKNLIDRATFNVAQQLNSVVQCLNVTRTSYEIQERMGHPVPSLSENASIATMSVFQHTSIVSSVEFGQAANGTLLGISRQSSIDYVFKGDGSGNLVFNQIDLNTLTIGPRLFTITDFFIEKRPWYRLAVDFNRTIWAPPFQSVDSPPKFIMTLSLPYYSLLNGQFVGVIALEVDLNVFANYVRSLPSLNNTRVLLLGRDGSLIAASTGDFYTIVNQTTVIRNPGDQSSDPVIRETIEQVFGRNLTNKEHPQLLEFSYKGNNGKRVVSLKDIVDPYGIEWMVVLNVANSDIVGSVIEANKINAIICSVCLVVSAFIAIVISSVLFRPLRRVCREMDLVADMEFESKSTIHAYKLFELRELRSALSRMKHGLRNFEKYVPSDIVKTIVRSREENNLGVVSKPLTVMFTDIKDFTSVAEKMDPNDLVQLMSEFFTNMSNIVMEHQGVVDKYIGDAIMALWNAPKCVPNHEILSVTAAVEMKQRLKMLNETWVHRNLTVISMRIGINSGVCLVGNVGSEQRMNYTVLGDDVNIASRCESLNKRYRTEIMITENTYKALNGLFLCRWLAFVGLKGKSLPINVYEVICAEASATDEQRKLCKLHNDLKSAISDGDKPIARNLCRQLLEIDENNATAKEVLDVVIASNGDMNLNMEMIIVHLQEK